MDPQPHIFFAGRYTYRRPGTLVASVVAILFGGYALRYLFLSIPHTSASIAAYGAAAFVGGIGSLLLLCGFILLRRWFARTSLTVEISTGGIRYGKSYHPWTDIRWFSGHGDRKSVMLFYQTRHRAFGGFDRPIPVDHNPTGAEFHNLVESLRSALSEKHPEVEFG